MKQMHRLSIFIVILGMFAFLLAWGYYVYLQLSFFLKHGGF